MKSWQILDIVAWLFVSQLWFFILILVSLVVYGSLRLIQYLKKKRCKMPQNAKIRVFRRRKGKLPLEESPCQEDL